MLLLEKGDRFLNKIGDYFYQKRVLPGNRHYTKFIILGTGRTGSNMLVSALNTHPNGIVYGEIFNNTRYNRIGFNNKNRPYISFRKALKIRVNNPISFLEDYIFRIFPAKTAAVGFKLFYWHCHEDNWRCIWDYMNSMQGLKIIHIKRRNMLKTFLSLKIAQRTKQWSQIKEKNKKTKPSITLDFNECVKIFEDWKEKERRILR